MLSLVPNIIWYADDTVLWCAEKNWNETQKIMQEYLNKVNYRLCINKLSLNANKTEFLTFSSNVNKLPVNFELYIGKYKIN